MIELIKFIFSTVGLTLILTNSKLFKPLREWVKKKNKLLEYLTNCSQCTGIYSGIIVYLLYQMNYIIPIININLGELINYGFIGSFVSYSLYLLLCPLIKKYD